MNLTFEYCQRNFKEACTSVPCSWLPPSLKEVSFAPLSDIDFRNPKKKLEALGNSLHPQLSDDNKNVILKPTPKEKHDFYEKLNNIGCDSAILRLIPPHNKKYISVKSRLKNSIFNFYNEQYEKYLYHELIEECTKTFLTLEIDQEDVDLIEEHTGEQSKSNLWFQARSGVITASKFRQCCHSDVSQPSKSLIMQVCYPEKYKFKSAATTYGINIEKVALGYLTSYLQLEHENVIIKDCGLIRSSVFPT